MITSILNDLLLLKDQPGEKIKEYIETHNIAPFADILEKFTQHTEYKDIILYIACAYSEDSPLVVIRQDSTIEQEGICDYLQIPDYKTKALIELKDNEVRKAATQYLLQFATPVFKSLQFMRIQLADIQLRLTNRDYIIKKEEEGVTTESYDQKAHGQAMKDYMYMSKQLDDLEKQLKTGIRNYKAIDAMREWKAKRGQKESQGSGIAIENSALIN